MLGFWLRFLQIEPSHLKPRPTREKFLERQRQRRAQLPMAIGIDLLVIGILAISGFFDPLLFAALGLILLSKTAYELSFCLRSFDAYAKRGPTQLYRSIVAPLAVWVLLYGLCLSDGGLSPTEAVICKIALPLAGLIAYRSIRADLALRAAYRSHWIYTKIMEKG